MAFGVLDRFNQPDYAYGILGESPSVAARNPTIADYLERYSDLEGAFRLPAGATYERYGELPVAPAEAAPGAGGQVPVAAVRASTGRDERPGMAGTRGPGGGGFDLGNLTSDSLLGGILGDDDYEGYLADQGVEIDPYSPERMIGKGAGLGSMIVGTGLAPIEAGAGLMEMGKYNEMLKAAGAPEIGVLGALGIGIDPRRDLRDVALNRLAAAGGLLGRDFYNRQLAEVQRRFGRDSDRTSGAMRGVEAAAAAARRERERAKERTAEDIREAARIANARRRDRGGRDTSRSMGRGRSPSDAPGTPF